LLDLYALWKEDENRFIQETRRFSEQLSEILQAEKDYIIHETDYAWNANSIQEEAESENTSNNTKGQNRSE
jgi:hypothetical protein